MDAKDRYSKEVLLKLRELGNCDQTASCNCGIHQMLLRILNGFDEERAKEARIEAERQEQINRQKIDGLE